MKDSVRIARNPVELFSTIPRKLKIYTATKYFKKITKYLFNQIEQNYKYF